MASSAQEPRDRVSLLAGWERLDPGRPGGRVLLALYLVWLGAWAVARSGGVDITHDEALTFLIHVPGTWPEVLAHSRYIGSNNHLLVTVLAKLLLGILPPAELVVRLPALLGLGLYVAACWSLLRAWTTGPRVVLGLVGLTANPFLVDMFTVARGYGLGLGLLAAAAAVSVRASRVLVPGRRIVLETVAAALAALAALANLSLVFGVAALGALAAVAAARAAGAAGRCLRGAWLAGAAAVPWALAALGVRAVYSRPVLGRIGYYVADWGGARGFWADSVRSLVEATLYGRAGSAVVAAVTAGGAVMLAAGAAVGGWCLWRRRMVQPVALVSAFVGLVWAGMALAHAAGGVRWPVDRSAIVLVPGLLLVLVTGWDLASRSASPAGKGLALGAGCLTAAVVVVELASANLSRTYLWPHDAATRRVMQSVAGLAGQAPKESVRMLVSWPLEPAVNFYRVTRRIDGLAPVSRAHPQPGADLYYLLEEDRQAVRELGLTVCREYRDAGTLLAAPAGAPCPPTAGAH
ncbi:MAG: hypothetical protein MUF10_07180 [Thermoanaerobaculaceae bacterium]|nr:hypothetical protein [Thermoanaerobaculaceae bacterium]